MFVEVEPEDLIVGEKYAIISRHDTCKYCTATFKYRSSGPSESFENAKYYSGIQHINMYNILRTIQNKNTSPDYSIYFAFVPQKERIQQAMEKRALDKILKRLIGDELFVW
jgi:hypothetical protein